jgi:hypothetical protein
MPKYTYEENTKKNSFLVILSTGLLAGTLDAIAAIINYTINGGKLPSKIFQYIASGAVGPQAFTGGAGMVILGIIFHYTIAFSFTLFFFLIFPGLRILSKNLFITGLVYGIFVWLIMNLFVVPMSNVSQPPFHIKQAIIGMLILMFAIGLPISFMIGRYYRHKKNPQTYESRIRNLR